MTCKLADQQQTLTFDAKSISIHNFDTQNPELMTLANWIEQGLTNQSFIILNITAEAVVGYGQEVYPSQELILDTGKTKSKVLYHINDKAGIHSQKSAMPFVPLILGIQTLSFRLQLSHMDR